MSRTPSTSSFSVTSNACLSPKIFSLESYFVAHYGSKTADRRSNRGGSSSYISIQDIFLISSSIFAASALRSETSCRCAGPTLLFAHFTLRALGVGWIQETQCGFKVCPPLRLQLSSLCPPCNTALHPAHRIVTSFQVRNVQSTVMTIC